MATKRILIFDPTTSSFEEFYREENDAMPYAGTSLTVGEFKGSSRSTLLWSDRRFMQTWRNFREYYGKPIHVGYCFKRIWEGGHGRQSQHYAGGSFDTGQDLNNAERAVLRQSAINFGGWSYVEPVELTPTWVHFDRRLGPPACSAGYPTLTLGSRNTYVLILQDALNALGFSTNGLDGIFGNDTRTAVRAFQSTNNLVSDGVVGCESWQSITRQAVGIGNTSTVVDP